MDIKYFKSPDIFSSLYNGSKSILIDLSTEAVHKNVTMFNMNYLGTKKIRNVTNCRIVIFPTVTKYVHNIMDHQLRISGLGLAEREA
jgi:hypothetical protein